MRNMYTKDPLNTTFQWQMHLSVALMDECKIWVNKHITVHNNTLPRYMLPFTSKWNVWANLSTGRYRILEYG